MGSGLTRVGDMLRSVSWIWDWVQKKPQENSNQSLKNKASSHCPTCREQNQCPAPDDCTESTKWFQVCSQAKTALPIKNWMSHGKQTFSLFRAVCARIEQGFLFESFDKYAKVWNSSGLLNIYHCENHTFSVGVSFEKKAQAFRQVSNLKDSYLSFSD